MTINKTIYFPDEIKELWPKIRSQAALESKDVGEWVVEAFKAKLNPDNSLMDDITNMLDCEGIDSKILEDNPKLKEAMLKFKYDNSDYNIVLSEYLRGEAERLKINIADY